LGTDHDVSFWIGFLGVRIIAESTPDARFLLTFENQRALAAQVAGTCANLTDGRRAGVVALLC
jgi:hypothetical protein